MASGSITDYGHQRGLWTSAWPGVAAWTTDTSLSPSYGMDHGHQHGGLSRRPNPENEQSSISDIRSLLRGGAIVHPGSVFRGRAFSSSRLLQTTLPAQLGNCTLPSLFMEMALQTVMCPTVYILPKYFYMQILIAMSHWPGPRCLVSEVP